MFKIFCCFPIRGVVLCTPQRFIRWFGRAILYMTNQKNVLLEKTWETCLTGYHGLFLKFTNFLTPISNLVTFFKNLLYFLLQLVSKVECDMVPYSHSTGILLFTVRYCILPWLQKYIAKTRRCFQALFKIRFGWNVLSYHNLSGIFDFCDIFLKLLLAWRIMTYGFLKILKISSTKTFKNTTVR